jgi:hypothetical protein
MKIKRVFLSTSVLTAMLTPNNNRAIRTVAGLPPGAKLLRVDQEINHIILTFAHGDFPHVDPGQPVPTQDIIMQWLVTEDKKVPEPEPEDKKVPEPETKTEGSNE